MSFKTHKIIKQLIITDENIKEKEELKNLKENIENSSLPFALIKLAINNNFIPLSIESYYEKIYQEINILRKNDGSKYTQNSIKTIKSALVTNKLFKQKDNKLYELNINEALKYIKTLKNKKNILKKEKNYIKNKDNIFLGKKRAITKNLIVNKYEKYQHVFQILNDLLESYPKKNEDGFKLKTNFNKFQSSIDLIEKTMDIDKICGMLITFKYFKPFLKKFLFCKNNNINYKKKLELNQQISGLKNDLDLVQSCIKKFTYPKNESDN